MQRARQLRTVIEQMLSQYEDVVFILAGGSFGGLAAQVGVLRYPHEFDGAISSAYNPSHRAVPNEHDAYDLFTSATGDVGSGADYQLPDALDWTVFCAQEGTDYLGMSFTNRLRHGTVARPAMLLCSDEDTVTNGTDWIGLMDDLSAPGNTNTATAGHVVSAHANAPNIYWSRVGKGCHFDITWAEPLTVRDTSGGTITFPQVIDAAAWFIDQEAPGQVGVGVPPPTPTELRPGLAAGITTLDPHDHVLNRAGVRQNFPSPETLLVESPTFQPVGQGTWFGYDESMVVADCDGDGKASIYVGSAQGLITRFEVEQISPSMQPLVVVAQSQPLGHGVWGLAAGDVDPNSPGDEIIAAAYRRIAVYDGTTLALLRSAEAPFGITVQGLTDPWLYTKPRRIAVDNLDNDVAAEIVFATVHGMIVVLDGNLNPLAYHQETGIIDIVVGPTPQMRSTGGPFHKPIYVLSYRGVVASLEWDQPGIPAGTPAGPAKLSAASTLQYGDAADLEYVMWTEQPYLLSMHRNQFKSSLFPTLGGGPPVVQHDSFRFFTPDTLDMQDSFGRLDTPAHPATTPFIGLGKPVRGNGVAVTGATHTAGENRVRYLVALFSGHLLIWNEFKTWLGLRKLDTFAPAAKAADVQSGDIDGDGNDEIVVSTATGRVVWFELAELMDTSQSPIPIQRNVSVVTNPPGGGAWGLRDHRTNPSISCTWAIEGVPGVGAGNGVLHALGPDQSWWKLDPVTGAPVVPAGGIPDQAPAPGFMLRHGGSGLSTMTGSGGSGHTAWSVASLPTHQRLTLDLYQPNANLRDWAILQTAAATAQSDFWIVPLPGDVRAVGSVHYAGWWNAVPYGGGFYPNIVQVVEYTPVGFPANTSFSDVWNSTGPPFGNSGNHHPPGPTPTQLSSGITLRQEFSLHQVWEQQSLRLAHVTRPITAKPEVVVAGFGGRVVVLDTFTSHHNPIVAQSADLGLGGQALAVHDLDGAYEPGDAEEEILFATFYDSIDHTGNPARASLHVLDYVPGQTTLQHLGEANIGGTALLPDFPGYGACAIAVADLDQDPDGLEILVCTHIGELSVFRWDVVQRQLASPDPVFRMVLDGSIGAFQSILIENLDQSHPAPEVYIAGTTGVQRLDPSYAASP